MGSRAGISIISKNVPQIRKFDDIITDIDAIIRGSLGIAAGGNINPEGTAMFEPIGGSAPKYAGLGQINPLAAISAAQMMLEYLGEEEAAARLLGAIKNVVKEKLPALMQEKWEIPLRRWKISWWAV